MAAEIGTNQRRQRAPGQQATVSALLHSGICGETRKFNGVHRGHAVARFTPEAFSLR